MPRGRATVSPISRDTGSQRALRSLNVGKVLDTLTQHGSQTQADLARLTGLSPGTVSNIVRELVDTARVRTDSAISSGRRSVKVTLVPDPRIVIGIDIGRTHVRMLASDTSHHTFGRCDRSMTTEHQPEDTFRAADEMLTAMLAEHSVDRDRVVMCGIAIPASVAPVTGLIVQGSVLPHWAGIDLSEVSAQILGIPTVLENDASLGALTQSNFGRYGNDRNLVYIKIATGIGAGISFGGTVLQSSSGLNGEIGHIQVSENTEICYCGNRGCLESLASTRRIVADLAHVRRDPTVSLEDVITGARRGDPVVLRILSEAGSALGKVLASVCNLLGPDAIILGGPLAPIGDLFLESVVQSVRQRALASSFASTEFAVTEFPDEDEVRGACALALQHVVV